MQVRGDVQAEVDGREQHRQTHPPLRLALQATRVGCTRMETGS